MILQSDEFKIESDGIWISKEALEELRTQFTTLTEEKGGSPDFYYLGKRDVMIDLLKHFEPQEP